jgi:hypothetical protein
MNQEPDMSDPTDESASVDTSSSGASSGDTRVVETPTPDDDLTAQLGLPRPDPHHPEPTSGGYQPPTGAPLLAGAADGDAYGAVPTMARRSGASVPTMLWGVILALVAAVAIVHQVSDVDLNLTVGLPVALLAVGAVLVVWGVAGLSRRRR